MTNADPTLAFDSLVAHWELEGNGNDSAGTHHAQIMGNPTVVAGRIGQALMFDGARDYLAVPHHADLTPSDTMTVTAWFRAASFEYGSYSWPTILKKVSDAKMSGYSMEIGQIFESTPKVNFIVSSSVGNETSISNSVKPNTWCFLAGVYKYDVGTRQSTVVTYFGKRGQLTVPSPPRSFEGKIQHSSLDLNIGRDNCNTGRSRYFHGIIDDVRIYDEALSFKQVNTLYTTPEKFTARRDRNGSGDPTRSFDLPVSGTIRDRNGKDTLLHPGEATESPEFSLNVVPRRWRSQVIQRSSELDKEMALEEVERITALGGFVQSESQLEHWKKQFANAEISGRIWIGDHEPPDSDGPFALNLVRSGPPRQPSERVHWVYVYGPLCDDAVLKRLVVFSELRILTLPRTKVTDAGLEQIKRFLNLEMLYLNGTSITDAGLEHLKGLSRLKVLGIQDTQITDAGVTKLKDLITLRLLLLKDTAVTADSVKALRQSLPLTNIDTESLPLWFPSVLR